MLDKWMGRPTRRNAASAGPIQRAEISEFTCKPFHPETWNSSFTTVCYSASDIFYTNKSLWCQVRYQQADGNLQDQRAVTGICPLTMTSESTIKLLAKRVPLLTDPYNACGRLMFGCKFMFDQSGPNKARVSKCSCKCDGASHHQSIG